MESTTPGERPFGFEPVEHTADVGLRVWGRTLEELFAQAGMGMASLLVDPETVRAVERRHVALTTNDLEEALVAWLQEILYLYEVGDSFPRPVTRSSPQIGHGRGDR